MKRTTASLPKHFILAFVITVTGLLSACSSTSNKKTSTANVAEDNLTLRDITGVRFFEVKRRFSNGLSFNKDGYMQKPNWIIEYQHPDTMLVYSPEKKGMESFYLQFDHGDVYNFAREFFRIKQISKDSVVLQRLEVSARVIKKGEVSDVICTFYTKDYIDKTLKTTIGELQKPTSADTAYIQKLVEISNQTPSNPKTAFAATEPVVFKPNSPNVRVEKLTYTGNQTSRESYAYMYPEYRMEINKAYKAFNLRFSVIVDPKGNLFINRVEGVLDADIPSRKKLIEGICAVYVKNLFHIQAGTTLGIAHPSEITLNLVGRP